MLGGLVKISLIADLNGLRGFSGWLMPDDLIGINQMALPVGDGKNV